MEKKSVFSTFWIWLNSTEMFARPAKQLPGKWQLFEYFIDLEDELVHVKEDRLKAENHFFILDFNKDKFIPDSNLSLKITDDLEKGIWSVAKNFITFIHEEDFRKNVEFQFAIQKGDLRLLKKDAFGKIQFFGFFRKLESK